MSLLFGRLILLGLIASLPACFIVNDFKENMKAYESKPEVPLPYRHSASDFIVTWNTVQSGNDTVIDGFIKNAQNIQVRNVSMDIQLLGIDGRALGKESAFLPQTTLYMNNSFSFTVRLKGASIARGNVLKFIINYRTNAGAWGGNSASSSFQVDATAGNKIETQEGN
jgi:hypothetical protein